MNIRKLIVFLMIAMAVVVVLQPAHSGTETEAEWSARLTIEGEELSRQQAAAHLLALQVDIALLESKLDACNERWLDSERHIFETITIELGTDELIELAEELRELERELDSLQENGND